MTSATTGPSTPRQRPSRSGGGDHAGTGHHGACVAVPDHLGLHPEPDDQAPRDAEVVGGDQSRTGNQFGRVAADHLDADRRTTDAHGGSVSVSGGDQARSDAHLRGVSADHLDADHGTGDAQCADVGASGGDHPGSDTQSTCVLANPLGGADQSSIDTHGAYVGAAGGGDPRHDIHSPSVSAANQPSADSQMSNGGGGDQGHDDDRLAHVSAADLNLALAAATLDDIERIRIGLGGAPAPRDNPAKGLAKGDPTSGRLRAMRDDHGLGDSAEFAAARAHWEALVSIEHDAIKTLERAMRRHPLGPWMQEIKGVGLKQGGRMLATIGDPAWNAAEDRPRRGPAELRQYCGHGDPARSRRRRGETVAFNPDAKMRVHLVAESIVKQRCKSCTAAAKAISEPNTHATGAWSPPPPDCTCRDTHPYRAVYDDARIAWRDRETTDLHKANHALRRVGKELLKDLYNAARET